MVLREVSNCRSYRVFWYDDHKRIGKFDSVVRLGIGTTETAHSVAGRSPTLRKTAGAIHVAILPARKAVVPAEKVPCGKPTRNTEGFLSASIVRSTLGLPSVEHHLGHKMARRFKFLDRTTRTNLRGLSLSVSALSSVVGVLVNRPVGCVDLPNRTPVAVGISGFIPPEKEREGVRLIDGDPIVGPVAMRLSVGCRLCTAGRTRWV